MKPSEKDIYRLMWEYLKLSDDYKAFCSDPPGRKSARKHPGKTPPKSKAAQLDSILSGCWKQSTLDEFKSKIKNRDLPEMYITFGDVFKESFDDWWERKGRDLAYLDLSPGAYEFYMQFKLLIRQYEKVCPPDKRNLRGFQELVLEHMTDDPYTLCLEIDLREPIGKIEKEVKELVNFKLQNQEIQEIKDRKRAERWHFSRYTRPTPNLKYDNVARYLKVVKAYKVEGLKGRAAFKKVFPDKSYDDANDRHTFFSDRRKGERIIRNVEKGYFPGDYEKKYPKS